MIAMGERGEDIIAAIDIHVRSFEERMKMSGYAVDVDVDPYGNGHGKEAAIVFDDVAIVVLVDAEGFVFVLADRSAETLAFLASRKKSPRVRKRGAAAVRGVSYPRKTFDADPPAIHIDVPAFEKCMNASRVELIGVSIDPGGVELGEREHQEIAICLPGVEIEVLILGSGRVLVSAD